MVMSQLSYEETRKQRLEENKRRMEELNINKLSQDLKPKPSPMTTAKPKLPRQPVDLSAVRRSTRVADQPARSYKEEPMEPLGRRSSSRSYSYRNSLGNRKDPSAEEKIYAFDRAEKLQSGLGSDFPSFVKPMLHSHVARGFWLGLPVVFSKTHLPEEDELLTLVDEDGNETMSKFLADKTGLSAGWRGFAIDHELIEGDVLVFQLVKPTTFKIFIIRVNETEEDDDEADEEAAASVEKEEDDEEAAASVESVDNSSKRKRKAKEEAAASVKSNDKNPKRKRKVQFKL